MLTDVPSFRWVLRLKRLLVGRPRPTSLVRQERLGPFTALAVLSSDALSSVAYGTEQIMRVLVVAGAGFVSLIMPASLIVVVVLGLVIVSYRQAIDAYPGGGGTYVVTRDTFGQRTATVAAAVQLLGNVLTAAVSAAAGAAALSSLVPGLLPYRTAMSILAVALLIWINLRGTRAAGAVVAVPAYVFVGTIFLLIGVGLVRVATGAMGSRSPVPPLTSGTESPVWLLLLAAVAQGSATVTGTEVIFSEAEIHRRASARQARVTLLGMGMLVAAMLLGLSFLAARLGVVPAEDETVLSQIGRAVFEGGAPWAVVQIATALILLLAASTAFLDFPGLASMLARDRFVPTSFGLRGDRLAFTSGVIGLGALAIFVLVAFRGDLELLVVPYTVGIFVNITLCQAGMVMVWRRRRGPRWLGSALVNLAGAMVTATVAAVLAVRNLPHSAWPVLLLVPALVWLLYAIHRHLLDVDRAREPGPSPPAKLVRVIVPIADAGAEVREALAYARSIAPDPRRLTAVHVEVDPGHTVRLEDAFARSDLRVPLVILTSPYRSLFEPLLQYIEQSRQTHPDEIVTVVIPELVAARRWHALLHNRSARRFQTALLSLPGVVVATVPYRLSR